MANTTNYGWETPDDTDLVKDGAAAIRTLGSSIDTTTKNLNPQTTLGDIAYRSATANTNTRLAIGTTGQVLTVAGGVPSWATPTTGDIEGVTAGTGISGGGTSGTVTITNSMATAIDAKGDLIVGTGADTFSRLPVGANTYTLVADSAEATGLKWAAPTSAGFVGCRLFNNGNQSISNNTFTAINFDSETYDTNTFHSTSSNTSRITIPAGYGGKYLILGIYVLQQNSTGVRLFRFNKNGSILCNNTTLAATAYEISGSLSTIESLSAGDYVEFMVYQDSGTSLNIKGDTQPQTVFSIAYLGA